VGKLPVGDDEPPAALAREAASAPPLPTREETAIVAEAVRALRSQHDPRRAAPLLGDYLRRFPRGALAEEALALEIEAFAAVDDERTDEIAREYLRRFPAGRYLDVARRVLARRAGE
jgi:hypothetical protein